MPYLEERVSAVETDIAEIRGDIHQMKTTQPLQGEVLARVTGHIVDLRTGQTELRTNVEDLRSGQAELRANVDKLIVGQDELRTTTRELSETLKEFRTAFNIMLDEVQAQKAWREEYSSKIDRVIAICEGVAV